MLLLVANAHGAYALEVRTRLSAKAVAIGEPVRFTVTVGDPSLEEVAFPQFDTLSGNCNLKGFTARHISFFSWRRFTATYTFDAFVTGKATLPKSTLKYRLRKDKEWREAEIPAQEIEVKSLLAGAGEKPRLKDIKEPLEPPFRRRLFVVCVVLCVLLCCGAVVFFLRRRKARLPEIPPRPAHEIAIEQLEALKCKDLVRQGKIKEYYVELSGIVRHYLENRFDLHAPDMTTEEFLIHVRDKAELVPEHKSLLKEFLLSCDLVKFAKYTPQEPEIRLGFESALRFVEQTKVTVPDPHAPA